MTARSSLMNVITRAMYKIARPVKRDFNEIENLQISDKTPNDFAQRCFSTLQRNLIQELKAVRPDYSLICGDHIDTSGRNREVSWLIKPLDGKINFIHGMPHFAFCVALQKRERIIAGAIYDPLKDELFWSEQGCGCFLNDRRLRVAQRKYLEDTLWSFSTEKKDSSIFNRQFLPTIQEKITAIRDNGCFSLDVAYVAAGRLDGMAALKMDKVDRSLAQLFTVEAGGYITNLDGQAFDLEDTDAMVLIANNHLKEKMTAYYTSLS